MSDSIKLHTMDLFSRFFQENQEKFLTFAYSYLRDKAEAEDVLMESMIALWENRNRWEEGSNLHALLLTIIKNKSLNLLEHKKIRLQAEENINSHNQRELNLRISTLKACEPEQIFDNEIQHIVHKALEQMPQQSRTIFMRAVTRISPTNKLPSNCMFH
jgi:RNA polymerase sigma-70 factor (ECF subfamily)